MNTKEYFDAKIELYKLVSGHTEDTMIDSLRRMGESMPQDASEEELSQAFAKVYAEQLQLLNNPQDGSIVVASEYMTSITNVVQEYLDVKKWRYNIIPFGAEVILYRIPFNVNNGNLINLDIAVKENPNILEIDAHIPYDTAVVEDIGSVISVANSDPDRKLGALIYSSFSEELSYSYRIITNHGLYIDDLDLAVTEVLTWATTIYGTLKGLCSTNRQEETIQCDTYDDSEGAAETTKNDSPSIPKDGLDSFSLQEKKLDFVKGFNVLSILTLGPGKYCISKNIDNHSDVMIDDGGYIWVRNSDSGDSVRTTVNVMEARLAADGCGGEEGVYALCEDGTGLHFAQDEIYYIIDGEYSGWGTAYEHFKEFPDGDSRAAHARVEEAMRQWACKHDLEKLDTATANADVGLDDFEIKEDRGLNNYSDMEESHVQGKKYDYLKSMGYSDSEIHSYSLAWNEAILDYLEDNKGHVLENMQYLQSDFDKDILLKLPVFYPDAFVLTPEIFSGRFEMLKNKFPYDYADIVQKQFWGYEGYDSVYVTMADGFTEELYEPFLGILHKDDQTVISTAESLNDPASRQYKFIAMLQKDIGLDVSTDDIQEEYLLDLECGKWEVLKNAKNLIADGLTKDLLLELLWHCPHILTYSSSELECILTEHFGDDYIEVLIQKYDNDENLGDELIEL